MKILKIRVIDKYANIPSEYGQEYAYSVSDSTAMLLSPHGSTWFLKSGQYDILETMFELGKTNQTATSGHFSLKQMAKKLADLEDHLSKVNLDVFS